MKSAFRELSKSQNDWVIGGVLCGIFLLLGIAIAWIGWWISSVCISNYAIHLGLALGACYYISCWLGFFSWIRNGINNVNQILFIRHLGEIRGFSLLSQKLSVIL